jgi:hypothetical protein
MTIFCWCVDIWRGSLGFLRASRLTANSMHAFPVKRSSITAACQSKTNRRKTQLSLSPAVAMIVDVIPDR